MTNHKPDFWLAATPLLLAIFLDSAGLGLFFPLLNALVMDPKASLLPLKTPDEWRYILYALTVSIYMLAFFFGAAILGDLSDKVGRRKVLILCLMGTFLGYIVAVFAVLWHSMTLLLVGRTVAGLTGGSEPIAQAAIIDLSTPETKAQHIAYAFLAAALGFMAGPLLGGLLSDTAIVPWFDFTTPFYFVAIMVLISLAMIVFFFKETAQNRRDFRIRWSHAVHLFASAFLDRQVRYLSVIFLFMIVAWSGYFAFVGMLLKHRYQYSTTVISLFWSVMAVGYAIGFAIIVPKVQRFSLRWVCIISFAISAISLLLTILLQNPFWMWSLTLPLGMGGSVGYSLLIVLFSNQVDESRQGWVMGVTGSVTALGMATTIFLNGILLNVYIDTPLIVGVIAYTGCVILLYCNRKLA